MITIARAIKSLNPKAAFVLDNNDYSTVQWMPDHEGVKPTAEEVQAELTRLQNASPLEEVRTKRRIAYQNESDPLFFKWQAGETTQEAWADKRNEIRNRYPEPA